MLSSLLFTLATAAPQVVITTVPLAANTAAPTAATTASPAPLPGMTCLRDSAPKTPAVKTAAISVTFQNTLSSAVDICWSNFAGNLVKYGTVEPNGATNIKSFVGHIWSIRQTAAVGCTGAPLSDPLSFQTEGVKDIGKLTASCTPVTVQTKSTPGFNPAAPTIGQADYEDLQKAFKAKFVTPENIPKLVRMSFHDLANFDPATNAFGGPHGCIFTQTVMNFSENNGLGPTAAALTAFLETNFPGKNYPMGDVISLAGKVAVETAFPGAAVTWRFGRSACNNEAVAGKALAPSPAIKSMTEMQPFLTRYALSANEMALLTSGAHAIANAQNFATDTNVTSFTFSTASSGLQFIKDSQDLTKVGTFFGTWYGSLKTTPVFGRFPSDMLFFPSTVSKVTSATANSDPAAVPAETFLNSIATEASFNTQFATVYAKMLEIGVSTETLTAFS